MKGRAGFADLTRVRGLKGEASQGAWARLPSRPVMLPGLPCPSVINNVLGFFGWLVGF